jgi:hypothetical protein
MFKLTEQPEVLFSKLEKEERKQLAEYIIEHPRECYVPNGENEKFIRTVANSTDETDVPIINCTFGNGVGKTTSALELIYNIIDPCNGWFDFPTFTKWKYPKTIWYVTTPAALKDKMEQLANMFPSSKTYTKLFPDAKATKESKNYIAKIKVNGFTIYGWSFEQAATEFESANVGLIINDEPAPEAIWKAEKSRRRMGCIAINIMTPLYVEPYIINEYEKAMIEGRNTHFHIEGSVYGACKKRGVRGHLDSKIIDDMVADYDPDEREARVYGRFMYFSSHIYPTYDEAVHVVDDLEIPKGSILKMINDPKDGKPDAVIWMYVFPNGRKYIVDEYPFEQNQYYWEMKKPRTIYDMVKDWYAREISCGYKVNRRIMDKRFGWQTRGDTCLAHLYLKEAKKLSDEINERVEMTFIESYTASGFKEGEVHYGHKEVRKALGIQPDGLPNLLIKKTCFHTRNGMKNYIRKHDTTKASSDKATTDSKIIEKYKDLPDCVRMGECDGLNVKANKPKTKRKPFQGGVYGSLR